MNAVKRAIDLNQGINMVCTADNVITHQTCDISILEEVLLMSYERRISL
jgi:hypothetical protein